ncbi:hypothetical protein OESDEN_23130 [Oesophagostomum dentatum]|uniref:Secreted protein n=1 Tax=Oesophagostomum dentatum TaxID=61180 RepID=A0A0B1S217_OESDE|nr:hypothetical protein OESDEN_23130 [Oesophagostomum dentatum]
MFIFLLSLALIGVSQQQGGECGASLDRGNSKCASPKKGIRSAAVVMLTANGGGECPHFLVHSSSFRITRRQLVAKWTILESPY